MEFDKNYFARLWGTVHRHDYCGTLADSLILRFGKCKILDIGTGCGYLVKTLRERGCDAWGLDVSSYAVSQTCAPGYVMHGSAFDIPFRDNRFDVVHSQGMWEYLSEDCIDTAFAECCRVGRAQMHTVDPKGSVLGEEEFATSRTLDWWNKRLSPKKIIIACPVHECKEYSMARWVERVRCLTYPYFEIFTVDNSPTFEFLHRWERLIPMEHIVADREHAMLRITQSMEVIRQKFLAGPYSHWFNLECDVIPPVDVIERMLALGGNTDWISHAFPTRGSQTDDQQGIGCSMLSRRLMGAHSFTDCGDYSPDGWLWAKVRPARKWTTMELWGYFSVEHLKEP